MDMSSQTNTHKCYHAVHAARSRQAFKYSSSDQFVVKESTFLYATESLYCELLSGLSEQHNQNKTSTRPRDTTEDTLSERQVIRIYGHMTYHDLPPLTEKSGGGLYLLSWMQCFETYRRFQTHVNVVADSLERNSIFTFSIIPKLGKLSAQALKLKLRCERVCFVFGNYTRRSGRTPTGGYCN